MRDTRLGSFIPKNHGEVEERSDHLFNLRGNMTAKTTLLGIFLGLSLSIICPGAEGQSATDTTETQVWPEGAVHLQLPSHLRVLTFAGLEQAVGYPFQQWYVAAALGYQFKPILGPHWENIDPDKEHHFLFGGGYEFLRTTQSGQVKHENRITIDMTPSIRPLARLLLRDRNWVELRWIDGNYSTTYRNMVSGEVDVLVHGVRFTPYGTAEVFYDGPKHSWDQQWYTAGIQWQYKRVFMFDTYYRRENCKTCNPAYWNVAGVSLNFYFGQQSTR